MKFYRFMIDKVYSLIISFIISIIMFFVLNVTLIDISLIIYIIILYYINIFIYLFFDYKNKYKFYNKILDNLYKLDNKCLVMETIDKPDGYEISVVYNIISDINKNFNDYINNIERNSIEFNEYIEMWIHEVKIPLASINLKCHNNKIGSDIKMLVRRLDNYLDSILYYIRSKDTDKDFCINEVNINDIIHEVILNNMDDLRDNDININVTCPNFIVYTDKKWISFIINQIINNSIKYKSDNGIIDIYCERINDKIVLNIKDNGIGIKKSDLNRVFDKSFTGYNGRIRSKSTGMGLYIVNNLIKKLGHDIKIDSKVNEYTIVSIIFGINGINITKM